METKKKGKRWESLKDKSHLQRREHLSYGKRIDTFLSPQVCNTELDDTLVSTVQAPALEVSASLNKTKLTEEHFWKRKEKRGCTCLVVLQQRRNVIHNRIGG